MTNGPKEFYQEAVYMQSKEKILWPFSLIGSCIVLPRSTIERIGYFDERFFSYYNDLDYSLLLTAFGLKAYTTNRSTIYHFGGASGKAPDILGKKEEDRVKFLEKWSQTKSFLDQYFSILNT